MTKKFLRAAAGSEESKGQKTMQTTNIEHLASQYPHLAAAFATIPQGEAHLRRLQDLNDTWQNLLRSGQTRDYTEVVITEHRPALPSIDTFDIIYAGGGLNLLNAAVMTQRYGLRVLVFDRFTVGAVHREWNISHDELRELLEVGLLTPDELESVIQREYSDGLIRFHSAHIGVPAAELHLKGVLDVAVDAEKLTTLCMKKIEHCQRPGLPNVILHNTTFQLCAVQPSSGVTVDVTSASGRQHSYGAHLLIDGMGSTSPIACQLNCGRPFSLVCPTVGTVARGYKQGTASDAIDPTVGEVLVTTEDAAAFQSPLTFCGFGSYVRNLHRITTLLALALENDCLQAADLNLIRASEVVPAVARAFSKFMIAKPDGTEAAWQVNETLNVFCLILYAMGPKVTNAFFKDRIGWFDYTRLVLNTPVYYPKIYKLAFSTLSLTEGIGWITAWLHLGRQSATFTIYCLVKGAIQHAPTLPPRARLRIAVQREAMEQVERGIQKGENCSALRRKSIGYRLGRLWPRG